MVFSPPFGQAGFGQLTWPTFRRRPMVRPPRIERLVLGLAFAFPITVAMLILPRLAGMGDAAAHVASTRPLSGAPASARSLATTTVTPPPTLEAPGRVRDVAGGVGGAQRAVPASAVATPVARSYVVQRGDELRHIAEQYGVSISTLLSLNEVADPDSLSVGQVLRLP